MERADFPICSRSVPEGWAHQPTDTWMHYAPDGHQTPSQGWKIHVSAGLDDAERALDVVWEYCVTHAVPFKFLRSRPVMTMLNSKSADRASSGKLVTVYPSDTAQFETVLKELDALLAGVSGPYILSDLRYGEGPLYVRYGGFAARRTLGENGRLVLAIEDGEGKLVPDVRGTGFALPSWVELPAFLQPHLDARNAVTTLDLPYRIESVLAFSNGGGVYLATDTRNGESVVLKEARPHAGLDAAERDAVTRLAHERTILERLAGLDAVPALRDSFTLGDHHFLAMEFVDGNPLQRKIVQTYPLTTGEDLTAYTAWALDMVERVDAAVEALHGRGVVFGDLHPNNILVTAEGRVVLIDFEVSTLVADDAALMLGNPAYAAPRDWRGIDVDRYAQACLRLNLFAPQATIMLPLDKAKVFHLAEMVSDVFPLPEGYLRGAVRTIAGQHSTTGHWPSVRAAMVRSLAASATPDRDDRLYPGDPAQFQPGGSLNLAYGAAGVLFALEASGAPRRPDHEDWLRKHLTDVGPGIGFYDGAHGVAYVLDLLGHRQDALDLVEASLWEQWELLELGLFSGLAGVGLNLLHLAGRTGENGLADAAARIVDVCADRLGGPGDVPEISGGDHPRAGLMYGSAGVALLFLHAYERTGDSGLLDRAADALRQDLRRCVLASDGSLQVNQGWRTLPYLDEGSVGIALVLARYLEHRADAEFSTALADARRVTDGEYFVQSGLFTGRAGMIAALAALGGGRDDLDRLARGLDWHALPYAGGLAFPGNQLLRLSMDLATGTAGVMFALARARGEHTATLPFIEPPGGGPRQGTAGRLRAHQPRKEV
ncbi:class III lanthionine synthetase LanKC [Nonomuraea sp. NPDC050556]|uniref:class III lanthionine synthetase LanKC n=1 Tax=Nonomuraea sp. NPDC050556 TaxID=3364369 RepID=UPI0037B7B79C